MTSLPVLIQTFLLIGKVSGLDMLAENKAQVQSGNTCTPSPFPSTPTGDSTSHLMSIKFGDVKRRQKTSRIEFRYFLKSLEKTNCALTSTVMVFGIVRIAQRDYLVCAKLQLKAS